MQLHGPDDWKSGNPGAYAGVPFGDYLAMPAASKSGMDGGANGRTMAHARHRMLNMKPTAAMIKGTAVHDYAQNPLGFVELYDQAGPCEAALKTGGPCNSTGKVRVGGHWYCGRRGHAPEVDQDAITVLSPDDHEAVVTMGNNLHAAPAIREIFNRNGAWEVSLLWEDLATGVRCKGRLDFYAETGVAVDIKTTGDASPEAWARTVAKFGYHRQEAFYRRGMEALGMRCDRFVFACVEASAPHLAVAYELPDSDVAMGNLEIDDLLIRWRDAVASETWAGYDTAKIHRVGLPAWYYTRQELAAEEL